MKQGLQLTAIGVVVGLAGALGLNRPIASVLFGVQPTDPTTLAAVIMTITLVAAGACWLPAWRASRFDPSVCSEPTSHFVFFGNSLTDVTRSDAWPTTSEAGTPRTETTSLLPILDLQARHALELRGVVRDERQLACFTVQRSGHRRDRWGPLRGEMRSDGLPSVFTELQHRKLERVHAGHVLVHPLTLERAVVRSWMTTADTTTSRGA